MVISICGGDESLKKITGLGDMESAMIGSLLASPMSNLKACVLSSIFLRQIAKKNIRNNSITALDIIKNMQIIDEIKGEVDVLVPTYKFKEPTLYGISEGDKVLKIKNAVKGGMRIYQLRDKFADEYKLGEKIINIKKEIGEECLFILNMGASYIGTGAFFKTETKKDASMISLENYKDIRDSVLIPVFPIGGIKRENLDFFSGVDIPGICMSKGIFSFKENEVEENVIEIINKLKI